eukprot:scaffold1853_cov287-Chaetoceros_neogracile.AAC.24
MLDIEAGATISAVVTNVIKIQSVPVVEIQWPCSMVVPSKMCETKVIHILHHKGEWGRGRDLAPKRLDQIQIACDQNHMTLYQALSLRRSMLRSFPNGMARVNQSSQMGSNTGQQRVATLFEEAVHAYLSVATSSHSSEKIFMTESELNAEMRAGSRPRGPTPDVLFLRPTRINGRLVKWIDAKLYYASVTYAHNKKIPNGKLQKIAQRYNAYYGGQGAFVFGQGYCADLVDILHEAQLLDATPLDMTAVQDFQNSS